MKCKHLAVEYIEHQGQYCIHCKKKVANNNELWYRASKMRRYITSNVYYEFYKRDDGTGRFFGEKICRVRKNY